ncbi:MAG: nucleotidyl transferase [Actinobacteria bacterium]|nr:nucleotidyl transferase [Actinomycetota bacterium]
MTRIGGELGAEDVRALFQELSDHLAAKQVHAQLFVVGGAAMALAYDRDRLTRDVDAVLVPAPEVREAAEAIADARGLEPDWLNDAAKGFLPGQDEHPETVFESDWLLVQIASPGYMLAMKLHASRDETDLNDATTLFTLLGYTTAEQAIELLTSTYPLGQLLPRHRYVAQDIAERAAARRAEQGL